MSDSGTSQSAAFTSGVVALFLQSRTSRSDIAAFFDGPNLQEGMVSLLKHVSEYAWDHFPTTVPILSTFDYIKCTDQNVDTVGSIARSVGIESEIQKRALVWETVRNAGGDLNILGVSF